MYYTYNAWIKRKKVSFHSGQWVCISANLLKLSITPRGRMALSEPGTYWWQETEAGDVDLMKELKKTLNKQISTQRVP